MLKEAPFARDEPIIPSPPMPPPPMAQAAVHRQPTPGIEHDKIIQRFEVTFMLIPFHKVRRRTEVDIA
jgi:hypothetical protein